MNPKFLELWRVAKRFPSPRGEAVIVADFNLVVRQGEFVSLIGHSGCGKSTVLSMIAGLSPLSAGGIVLDNREIDRAGPDRGVVFQAPCLLPWLTALENVLLGVAQVHRTLTRRERRDLAASYLDLVGLGDDLNKRPAELSQGMRQRVGIARAFALKPKILLLDEPFGMLDAVTRMELQDVLLELWSRDKITAVMVTHDVDEALLLSDRVVMMTSGPAATVGEILAVDLARPRDRHVLLEDDGFYALRERLIGFLEAHDRRSHDNPSSAAALASPTAISLAASSSGELRPELVPSSS
jgi:nitrate/nitrite transport system ATP-binding protein